MCGDGNQDHGPSEYLWRITMREIACVREREKGRRGDRGYEHMIDEGRKK